MIRHCFAIAACAALATSGPLTAQGPTVCERLAEQIGLHKKTAPPRYGENVPEWRLDLVGGLKGALIGGTATARIGTEPVDGNYEGFEEQCKLAKRGATCDLSGPVLFRVETLDREGTVEIAEGERAYFEMRNTKLICRSVT